MPTYDYRCTACNHEFEITQRMTDAPLDLCPECGGRVKRLIGAGAGIIFKGSGFYATDYRSNSYQQEAKKETSSSAAPASSGSTSEAKTTKTADAAPSSAGKK